MILTLALVLGVATQSVSFAAEAFQFERGFKILASEIPGVVGTPIEFEHYGPNGDSLQRTTTGLMVWRKADNWTAFTDGATTWINGPDGVQDRANDDRFAWEPPAVPMAVALSDDAPPLPSGTDPGAAFPGPSSILVSHSFTNSGTNVIKQVTVTNRSSYWSADLYLSEIKVLPAPDNPTATVTVREPRTITPKSIKPGETATFQQTITRGEYLDTAFRVRSWSYLVRFLWTSPDRKKISMPQEQVIELSRPIIFPQ